jgi:dUTP pyrophosphatase
MDNEVKVIPKIERENAEENENIFEELEQSDNNPLDAYFAQIENVMPEFGGMEEIGAMLALDDKDFAPIANAFLVHLQRAVNNLNDKMILIQGMNAAGYKAEDIIASYVLITQEIDEQLGDMISPVKRDFVKQMLGIITNTIADTEGIAKRIIQIPIELMNEDAKIPTYAHIGDAGCDVYAIDDYTIAPGETKIIPTGLKMIIPEGYEIQVRPRSGLSAKTKMRVANAPGTIDSSYRGEIGIIVENIEPPFKDIDYSFNEDGSIKINSIVHGSAFSIGKGERIAQFVLSEVPKAAFYAITNVEEYAEISYRGDNGFGSTDTEKENG